MNYIKGLAFALLIGLPTHASAQAAQADGQTSSAASPAKPATLIPPEMMARYARAKWTYPGSNQMADMYPEKAQDNRQEGMAKIVCVIAADGTLDRCAVMNETPASYGFGVATATAFVKYAHVDPATVGGGIKPGDYKVFLYKWQLG